jgi:hypothetical protein
MMLFYLIVLAICQVGILVFYSIESSNPTAGKFKIFIPSPRHLSVVNVLAAIAIFSVNRLGQFFCVPVDWAAIALVIFALSMVIYPFLEEKNKGNYVISFIHGIGLLICLYCIFFYRLEVLGCLFLALIYGAILFAPSYAITELILKWFKIKELRSIRIVSTPALFTAIVVGLPIFWLIQIVKRFIESNKIHKAITVTSCVLMLVLTSFFVNAYKTIIENKEAILKIDSKVISPIQSNFFGNYMLEKAIGWALVYHTETCIYDGWRPPMHDPFLVVSNWLLTTGEPLDSDFDMKVKLYKALYPDVPIKKKCSCGIEESNTYFSDPRF